MTEETQTLHKVTPEPPYTSVLDATGKDIIHRRSTPAEKGHRAGTGIPATLTAPKESRPAPRPTSPSP